MRGMNRRLKGRVHVVSPINCHFCIRKAQKGFRSKGFLCKNNEIKVFLGETCFFKHDSTPTASAEVNKKGFFANELVFLKQTPMFLPHFLATPAENMPSFCIPKQLGCFRFKDPWGLSSSFHGGNEGFLVMALCFLRRGGLYCGKCKQGN